MRRFDRLLLIERQASLEKDNAQADPTTLSGEG